MPGLSRGRPVLKFVLVSLALGFLILAVARPRLPGKLEQVTRQGAEIILAVDVSRSMLAEDIRPNRLTRAKMAIEQMLKRLVNDRVGLIVFAGRPYVQVPVTADYSAAQMFLRSVSTSMVEQQGTDLGAAIELATKSFSGTERVQRALVIISDGEDHEAAAIEQASLAAEKGIIIHTIGMGLADSVPIPDGSGQGRFIQKPGGGTALTALNEQILMDVAQAGGGVYVQANNAQSGLELVHARINDMEKAEFEAKTLDYEELFAYFVGAALILLSLDFFVREKKSENSNFYKRWVERNTDTL